MVRRTQSGAQWSAWELDELRAGPSIVPPRVQIIRARVSLVPYLCDAMEVAEQRATVRNAVDGRDNDEWEDKDPVLSCPATPILRPATPLPTTSWSRSPSPLSDLRPSPPPTASASPCASLTLDALPSPISHRKERQAEGHRARRRRQQVAEAKASRFGPVPQARHSQDYRQEEAHQSTFRAACDLPTSAGGNWMGPRASKKARLSRQQLRCLHTLLAEDWDLVEWNGRDPKLILDADGHIVAVLLGHLEGDDWDNIITEMVRVMEGVRARGVERGGGLTKGPGQKKPGNLAHGFQSSGLARYLPKLYQHYKAIMQSIVEHQPELVQLFPNSIFPTATFNLGPDVVTPEHLDI
ncbi:hypothetical protein B0H14DRAFT_3447369 [Mycena olivaceomarginata]|nr:hypothetical protein B0H14DRAFT_3447369 [Mycena olivaceomarginata]